LRVSEAVHAAAQLAGDGIITEVRMVVGPESLIDPRDGPAVL
jgi:hypothetical protein